MAITFGEIKPYISRLVRISICFTDGHYDNYTLISDIPNGKYDDLYVYGIGMVDVEFPMDVYAKPSDAMPEKISLRDGFFLGCGLEIVLQEEPRDIARSNDSELLFDDLRGYLQIGRYFSVVMKEDWSSEQYEYREDIPDTYNELYVYGIGIEHHPRYNFIEDSYIVKQLVVVLSKAPREDIKRRPEVI